MSFRELRDFTEYMRVLGYPRLVSVDNFRTPNFGLVADILYWMVHRYDPSVSISDDISTEDCRVEFLTSVAHVMWSKSGLKLNTKRLYSADGKAVKELLKVANLLYAAHKANVDNGGGERGDSKSQDPADDVSATQIQGRLPDVKTTRKLASAITESGAKLFDLLDEERDMSAERQQCLRFLDSFSNNLDSTAEHRYVERRLGELLASARENASALEKQCLDLASDEKTLQVKIKKKQSELERNDKRLKSLQSVRPAFMDEYEKLEGELARQYEVYLEKFRNLDYLEHRLEAFNRKEREKLEESERARKRIQMNVLEKKARDLMGDEEENLFEDEEEVVAAGGQGGSSRPASRSPADEGRQPQAGSGKGTEQRRPKEESDLSGDSDASSDVSGESSLSGSLSGSDDEDDLLDGEEDGEGSLSEGSNEDGGSAAGSNSGLSDESDDNF